MITRKYLERRTAGIENGLKRHGLHPGEEFHLTLDYYLGGYKMIFTEEPTSTEHHYPLLFLFFLSAQRLKASEMDSYQQGFFDLFHALTLKNFWQ